MRRMENRKYKYGEIAHEELYTACVDSISDQSLQAIVTQAISNILSLSVCLEHDNIVPVPGNCLIDRLQVLRGAILQHFTKPLAHINYNAVGPTTNRDGMLFLSLQVITLLVHRLVHPLL